MRSQNTTELESLVLLRLTNEPIAIHEVLNAVRAPECGGLSLFVGTVRNHSGGRGNVLWLEYEAYESMALKKMREMPLRSNSFILSEKLPWCTAWDAWKLVMML